MNRSDRPAVGHLGGMRGRPIMPCLCLMSCALGLACSIVAQYDYGKLLLLIMLKISYKLDYYVKLSDLDRHSFHLGMQHVYNTITLTLPLTL